jgi:ribosomal protein L24E
VHKTGKLSYYCSGKCYKNDFIVKRKLSYIRKG